MAKKKEVVEVVRIFIASPGDVRKERTIFRDVIEDLNVIKAAKEGKQLVPVGWEDTLPGRGRPQALINDGLVSCDLIIGLLWRRWGTPTGEYSSGFEEEYELAREHDIPMWLYFRHVEEAMMADPGAQLRQVLDFRDRIERERAMLFHSYADEQEWEKKLRRNISLWLDKLPPDPSPEIAVDDLQARIAELEEALEKAKSDQEKAALDLVKDAWEFADNGQLTRAEEFFARAVNVAPEPSVRLEHTRFLFRTGQLERVKEILEDLLNISEANNDKELESRARGNLGNVYHALGDWIQAEEMYRKVLEINEALGRKEGIADAYTGLGVVYGARGELMKAEEILLKSLEIEEALGRKENMAGSYGNLGSVYYRRGDLDKSEEMYLKSLEINEALGRKEGMANAYAGLGIVYGVHGGLDKAEEMLRKSLEISEALDFKELTANQCINLGRLYRDRGELDKAEELLRKSLALFEKLGSKPMVEKVKALIEALEEAKREQR